MRQHGRPEMLGRTISHYRIEEKLGEGGMGVVYRATDLSLNRNVAIKFLSCAVADEERRRRFQLEAQAASSLNHPHILTVFEAGTEDGQQYLVTEFIDGWTLRGWAKETQPSLRQMLELMASIGDALATAHQAGIVHRDLKPDNILVSRSGYAKLVDFGLAKLVETTADLDSGGRTRSASPTRAGTILGTTSYMSPEQAAGSPVDPRSDIFSFGVVLYELLAGTRPFSGSTDIDVLRAILREPPSPLAGQRPDLPAALLVAVDKALEKDPADRYQSARELVVDLRRALRSAALAIAAPPLVPGRTAVGRRWILGGAAAAVLLVLAGAVWRWRPVARLPENPLADARITRLTDFESSETGAAISADGKLVTFISDRDGTYHAWVTQVGSGEFLNLTKGRIAGMQYFDEMRSVGFTADATQVWVRTFRSDSSGEELPSLWLLPTLGGAPRLFLDKGVHAAWSPDGSKMVYHEFAPGDPTFVADANGTNRRQIFIDRPGVHCHYHAWSPDGQWIYFVRGFPPNEMDIWRMPAGGGPPEPERITHHNSRVGYPTLLNGRTMLYIATAEDSSDQWLYSMDLDGRVARRITLGVEQYTSIAAASGPGGTRLVATVSNPTGNLWTVPISERTVGESAATRLALPSTRAELPRYGSGYTVYASSRGGPQGLWKFAKDNATELWKGSDGGVAAAPAVSRDGKQICFTIRKQGRTSLYAMTAEGTNVHPLAPQLDVRDAPSWSPDGQWIAIGADEGQGSRLFKVPVDGGAPVRLADSLSRSPVWSPDGRYLVYSAALRGAGYTVRAITPEGQPFPLPDLWVQRGGERYHFLPDGKALIVVLGDLERQNFWLLELPSGRRRQLTDLRPGSPVQGFDVSPDGRQILFDRVRDNSDIVLIEPARK